MPKRRCRTAQSQTPEPIPAGDLPVIKVVGMSGAGKSTLVKRLRAAGYNAKPVSQEHSSVPTLWQQFEPPAALIYLNVAHEAQASRRPDISWTARGHRAERLRLQHARDHADLRIDTTTLSPDTVLSVAITFLQRARIRHAPGPLIAVPATGTATGAATGASPERDAES